MPLYEYKCTSCGKEFEELKSFSDSDKTVFCPDCGKEAVREYKDVGAVIYKGSGYYCKDHHSSCGSCEHGGKE